MVAWGRSTNDQAVDLVLVGSSTSSSDRVYLGDGYGNFLAPLQNPMGDGVEQYLESDSCRT
jgi:hypothetical protein